MTAIAQNPSRSRALAVGILILLIVLVLGVLLSPMAWLYNRYDKILEQSADQLMRFQRVAATTTRRSNRTTRGDHAEPRLSCSRNHAVCIRL